MKNNKEKMKDKCKDMKEIKQTLKNLKVLETEWKAKIAELDDKKKEYQNLIDNLKVINEALQSGKLNKKQENVFMRLYESVK